MLQELEDLCFSANTKSYRWIQTDEPAVRAEAERKKLAGRLARVEENRASAEERLRDEQERISQLSAKLRALQEQCRNTEYIWAEEVNRLHGQLLTQQQWLPTITVFKLFQTVAFGEYLLHCVESFRAGVVATTLDEVMEAHPEVDLRNHEGYNPRVVDTADEDLMKAVLSSPAFPFLEELQSSSRVHTFEEIISSSLDKDLDYQRVLEQGVQSTLQTEALGLVLVGQSVGNLADLSESFEEADREAARALDAMEDPAEDIDSPVAMEDDVAGRPEEGSVAVEEHGVSPDEATDGDLGT